MMKKIYSLKIDTEFKKLIPPLALKELYQLEENLVRDGCREPICVWNNIILDGHNRYEICSRLQIPFSLEEIKLHSHEEAIAWICENQLGRRNISASTRKYLIGKRYEMEKMIGAHNVDGINQYTPKEVRSKSLTKPRVHYSDTRTRERLASEYHISDGSVYRYGVYAHSMDKLSKTVPEVFSQILTGKIKANHSHIVALTKLPDQTIKSLCKILYEDEDEFTRIMEEHITLKKHIAPVQETSKPFVSVKNMPSYDPDAEISTLSLTIPSWISSINRIGAATDLSKVSDTARIKLKKELLVLKKTTESMLIAITEVL